jgi:sucrose-6-phosphate hydrolase SacC (GH32 family)
MVTQNVGLNGVRCRHDQPTARDQHRPPRGTPTVSAPSPITQEEIEAARRVRLHLLADPYRPAYHFIVPEDVARPAGPNGALFWYQERGVHYWGHVSSLDLLHERHHPPSLFPTPGSPEEGIFSGNGFVNKAGEALPTSSVSPAGR